MDAVVQRVDPRDATFHKMDAIISAWKTKRGVEAMLGSTDDDYLAVVSTSTEADSMAATTVRSHTPALPAVYDTPAYLQAELDATTATLDDVRRRLEAFGGLGPPAIDGCKAGVSTIAHKLAATCRATTRAIDAMNFATDAKPKRLVQVAMVTSPASNAPLQRGSVEAKRDPRPKRKRDDAEVPSPSPHKVPAQPSMALPENDDPVLRPLLAVLVRLRAKAPWTAHDRPPYLTLQPGDSASVRHALTQHNLRVQAFHHDCDAIVWERLFLWPSRDATPRLKALQKRVMELVVDLVVLVHTGVVDERIYACLLYPHPSWPSVPVPVDLKRLALTSGVKTATQYLRKQHRCLWPLPPRRANATTLGSAFQTTLDVLQAGVSVAKWAELTNNIISRDDVKAACVKALQSRSTQTIATPVPMFAPARRSEPPPPAWALGAPTYLYGA